METLSLACPLTERELLERGARLADLHHDLADLENAKKDTAAAFKARIETIESEAQGLARQIRGRAEYRDVEVKREKDFARNVEEVIRLDSGEVVATRALTPQERQEEMFRTNPDVPAPQPAAHPEVEAAIDRLEAADVTASVGMGDDVRPLRLARQAKGKK